MILSMFNPRRTLLVLSLVMIAVLFSSVFPVQALTGSYGIHDPSLIQVGSCYYAFGTGDPAVNNGNIRILKSCGGISGSWAYLKTVFNTIPSWIPGVIGSTPGNLWAPEVVLVGSQYRLYYAASTFGSNRSVIALATATNIEGPWTDAGEVLRSTSSNNYNAIDPDYINGKLSFGSFWDGIKMIDINTSTGKRSGTAMYNLASRGGGAIEAASITHNGSYYYLFVSFDKCCSGTSSTYRIMVGRSTSITGPYVDKNGVNMMSGGGSQILATNGSEIGPGGEDVLGAGNLAYHFYDGNDGGAPKLAIRPLTYSNGWPVLGAKR
jgi:arabinan endo-1,5-alpha-L-arabinosidase